MFLKQDFVTAGISFDTIYFREQRVRFKASCFQELGILHTENQS